jgi:hypothetical protein
MLFLLCFWCGSAALRQQCVPLCMPLEDGGGH